MYFFICVYTVFDLFLECYVDFVVMVLAPISRTSAQKVIYFSTFLLITFTFLYVELSSLSVQLL